MLNTVLKGIVIFVLLSISYAIYVGVTNKGDEIITEVQIDAPVEVVYDYLTDLEKSKEWLIGLKSIEQISGDSLVVGAQYRVVYDGGRKDIVMTETITSIEQNQRFAFSLVDDFMTGEVDITLKSGETSTTSNGTFLKEVNTFRGNSFMSRMMTGLFKQSFKQGKKQMYDKLKEVSEAAR